ncbi:ethanolamine kinase 1 [Folsomia candida]|uniref:ethanolamine kinase 1 n=1 Tax=Folsomia candida TaxID=158441 RepID=UPI000B901329|nr:ethanolamine kinase 1 [Folsomia candida]
MPLTLEITLRDETLEEDAFQIIKVVRPNWNPETVRSKLYTGGISNKLIGYYQDGKIGEDVVMIRMYGQNTELMIDRKAEIDTMILLHGYGLGPELYAIFRNGICYEFIQGRILSMEDVRSPEVYPRVVAEMVKMHCDIPSNGLAGNHAEEAGMWNKIRTFDALVEEILQTNPTLVARLETFGFDVSPGFGTRAIKEMENILKSQNMPITFCHNDLLLGNIIYDPNTSKVSFIDFEYAMPNYPAFDVANHFNEFAGIDNPDFDKCPDRAFKSKWIAEYLKGFKLEGVELSQEKFEYWIELCQPASHLFWSLWAIVQAHNSKIDFDFAGYFGLRYIEYDKQMKEVRKFL